MTSQGRSPSPGDWQPGDPVHAEPQVAFDYDAYFARAEGCDCLTTPARKPS